MNSNPNNKVEGKVTKTWYRYFVIWRYVDASIANYNDSQINF